MTLPFSFQNRCFVAPKGLIALCCLSILLFLAPTAKGASGQAVIIGQGTDSNSVYTLKLLELVFSELNGRYQIEYTGPGDLISSERMVQAAMNGALDVVWMATNNEVEEKLIPIRIPLFMGMLGYRICLVHADNRNILAGVKNFDELKRFTFGQGRGWTDTAILKANGLDVIESNQWIGLFHMTDGKRFDAYPRGLHEPWGEVNMVDGLELAVDPHVALVYRMPFYLFVNPERPDLARALEGVLEQMVADKRMQNFLLKQDFVATTLKKAQLDKRQFFYLNNPAAPTKTPVDRKELWLESLNLF